MFVFFMFVGFKNGIDGFIGIVIDVIKVVGFGYIFLFVIK